MRGLKMTEKTINLAEDYNSAPIGRYVTDGDYTGEGFREDFLAPALDENDKVIIELDGLDGIGPSFWEEAFGGLIREGKFTKDDLDKKLELKCSDDEYLVEHVKSFIEDAVKEKK